jgi:hypothetical protein
VVIEESKVLRRGRDESHVPPDLVQFSVALRLNGMCRLECVDLQSGPRVQCKVPTLLSERPSEIEPKSKSEEKHTRSSMWMVFFALLLTRGSGSLTLQAVEDVLLFEVIPYYLKWLDGVRVLFTVSHRENSEHRGFIQH